MKIHILLLILFWAALGKINTVWQNKCRYSTKKTLPNNDRFIFWHIGKFSTILLCWHFDYKSIFLLLIYFFQYMNIIDKDVNKTLYIRTIGRKFSNMPEVEWKKFSRIIRKELCSHILGKNDIKSHWIMHKIIFLLSQRICPIASSNKYKATFSLKTKKTTWKKRVFSGTRLITLES